MVSDFAQNMLNLVASVPINLIIVGIICLVLLLFGKTLKTILRVIGGYFLTTFLFSILGLTMPSIPAVFMWLKKMTVIVGDWLTSIGIL